LSHVICNNIRLLGPPAGGYFTHIEVFMKVVHVLKRIEIIDEDIKDLKKLEKSISRNKSFSTPIYMSIEKQINILLGERIKMFELQIADPPESLVEAIEGKPEERGPAVKKAAPKAKKKTAKKAAKKRSAGGDMGMLTQDMIDSRFEDLQKKEEKKKPAAVKEAAPAPEDDGDESVKILDIALEKGTLNKKEIEKEKKVRFFRENFPTD